jgi:YHS domain-containing protein
MLKIFAFFFSLAVLFCSIALAQEKPQKENEESVEKVEVNVEMETEGSVDTEESVETEVKEIWNKVCPVKGNPVEDDTPTVEYNGKTYGFCCPGCDQKFAENPEKYSKNLNEDGSRFIGRK